MTLVFEEGRDGDYSRVESMTSASDVAEWLIMRGHDFTCRSDGGRISRKTVLYRFCTVLLGVEHSHITFCFVGDILSDITICQMGTGVDNVYCGLSSIGFHEGDLILRLYGREDVVLEGVN